ncbi:MAG: hypothetical protein ABI895_30880 [Deltaproteobacteria bacterium]
MIAKFFPLTVALVTAVAGSAAAHETHGDRGTAPYRAPAPAYSAPAGHPYAGSVPAAGYRAEEREELRRSDLNRDGRVTLTEALQQGRRGFRHSDRDQNRALTPREVSWGDLAHEDRDRNGRISYAEYQDAIRRTFYRFDTNRDGVLARYELRATAQRSAGWRR